MLGFLYSVFAYLAFLACFSGLGLFADGLLLPKTVDTGAPVGLARALTINLGLLLIWGIQHSVMARQGFKRWVTRFIPVHLERATYVLVSSLALLGLMLGWQPVAGVLWQVESTPLVVALWGLNAMGWLCVPLASFLIDHFDLFGLKQSFHQWRRGTYERKGFVMPWLYRYVRHPMMSALLVGLWATPYMTASHFGLSLGLTAYVLIGLHFEERSLRRELGEAYAQYQQRVPKLVPRLGGPSQAPVVSATAATTTQS